MKKMKKISLLLMLLAMSAFMMGVRAQEHSSYYTAGKQSYDSKNYGQAFEQFKQGAEQGHADAQNALGDCYYEGEGVAKDLQQAYNWYKKAADQGYADAQYNMGYCLQQGEGVAKNLAMAASLFEKAAEQGNADAQSALGDCYYEGTGVNKDLRAAFYWFNKAAFQGQVDGMYSLGYCYLHGEGTAKDIDRGISWLKQAAEQGHDFAQQQLGHCYAEGEVVSQDLATAKRWLEKAAAQGNEDAKEELAELNKAKASSPAKQTEQQTEQQAEDQPSRASVKSDAPQATKAELAALKKFMTGMVGHTYQCGQVSVGEPIDYIMSTGGMRLVQSVTFISKTKATLKTTLKLNSSASRMSMSAYQIKESIESKQNFTGTVETWGPYLVLKRADGEKWKFMPREGTLKLVTPGGNVYKKVK